MFRHWGSGTSGLVYVDSTQVQYQEEVRFRVSGIKIRPLGFVAVT
jgi:hypothetical protein